jgi:zinc transporter 1/2/3
MLLKRADEELNCGQGGGDDSLLGLRIASIFIILCGSMLGALFPVAAKRSSWLHVSKSIFECVILSWRQAMVTERCFLWIPSFAKYFGSGVIVSIFSIVPSE